jgi:OOP family OmpA-OmpF porin
LIPKATKFKNEQHQQSGPMHLRNAVYTTSAVVLAASLAALGAWWSASAVENRSAEAVKSRLLNAGLTWAVVETNGLQVRLSGTAPNEASRFRAVNLVGTVVQSARIRDSLGVTAIRAIEAPRFSVEILRNDEGISLIGLLPGKAKETELTASVTSVARGLAVSDMLETADYPAPENWTEALEFGLFALKLLPRSKISVAADLVVITAISSSAEEKRKLESELSRNVPNGVTVEIGISAPRPVLTPFTLRFVMDERGARFDACSADTVKAQDRILKAGVAAGVTVTSTCTVGLGVPTPRWVEAAEKGISAVTQLGGGTITFSDADVSLVATVETPQALFDRVVGDLQTQLPPVFSLQATLPPKPSATAVAEGPAEFTAELAESGQTQLRGRITDAVTREAVDSFARAQFGADRVYTGTRLDDDLPDGWPVRVLAGIEALAQLHHGNLMVRSDMVEISGVTGRPDGRARISQILSDKLGQGKTFRINVAYDKKYDPLAALPTPQECAARMNAVQVSAKIGFAPGSAEMDAAAQGTLDALAEVLTGCPPLEMEIGGHTDSQGSEGGNRALSQARAEAVLTGLQGRRLQMAGFVAKGYGEDDPIAENDNEAGREANRRIEFTLLSEPEEVAPPSPLDLVRAAAQEAEAQTLNDDAAPELLPAGPNLEPIGPEPAEAVLAEATATEAPSDPTDDAPAIVSEEPEAAAQGEQVAALETPIDLGTVRSIVIEEGPSFLFQRTDEKWPRPRRRP